MHLRIWALGSDFEFDVTDARVIGWVRRCCFHLGLGPCNGLVDHHAVALGLGAFPLRDELLSARLGAGRVGVELAAADRFQLGVRWGYDREGLGGDVGRHVLHAVIVPPGGPAPMVTLNCLMALITPFLPATATTPRRADRPSGGELVECVPVIGADTGGLFGCGGLGALGAGDGGGLSLTCPARIALSMVGACLGVGDLAGDVLRAALISRSASSPAWRTLFGGAIADAACLLLGVGLVLVILRPCG